MGRRTKATADIAKMPQPSRKGSRCGELSVGAVRKPHSRWQVHVPGTRGSDRPEHGWRLKPAARAGLAQSMEYRAVGRCQCGAYLSARGRRMAVGLSRDAKLWPGRWRAVDPPDVPQS